MGLLDRAPQAQRFGLLSPDVMNLIQSGGPRVAPAPTQPRRERVSGWRVFDRVLGGQTVTEGLDAERARLQAEAMRPQMEAQRQQILATIQDPRERALFMTAPSAWAENVGHQFRPRTLAPGSVERVGGATVGAAPVVERFDDRFGVFDPLNPQAGAQYSAPRGATHSEETARMTARRPVELAPGTIALNPDGTEFGRGAERILSAADGTDLVTEGGNRVYGNTRDAPAADPVAAANAERAAAAAEEGRAAMARNLATGLAGARQYVRSAGVWSQFNPLNRQARANLEGHLDTIKGNITFERLSEMKRNSPNGASGMGALSDNEARMLASTVAALSPDMSPEELSRSFEVIDRLVAKLEQPSPAPAAGRSSGPIAQDAQGNRVQWNGSAWVPI